MNYDLALIAERLFGDSHGQIPLTTVITVLREYAAEHPEDPPELIEHAVRNQLQIHDQGHQPGGCRRRSTRHWAART